MGILEILTIVFVVLKLVGVITWSWWLVFLPAIVAAGIYLLIYGFYFTALFRISRDINREIDDDFLK